MDVIITAIGEFIWATSCALVNFCISSGFSVLTIFVSFLCAILASAFYKYSTRREQMSLDHATCPFINHDNDDLDKPITIAEPSITASLPVTTTDELSNIESVATLSEIEISLEENQSDNEVTDEENPSDNVVTDEEPSSDVIIDTIEGTEEEIQKQQIANIYRLLNDQHLINNWSTTDFLDQLKMYGLQAYEEDELEQT